jgi:hypothetical protein
VEFRRDFLRRFYLTITHRSVNCLRVKTIIAGSRGISDYQHILDAVRLSGLTVTEVVSGGARGVDRLGERWAHEHGVRVRKFIPDWSELGRSAGPVRNAEMAEYSEALIAIWNGSSRGTKHMIDYATAIGLRVFVHRVA